MPETATREQNKKKKKKKKKRRRIRIQRRQSLCLPCRRVIFSVCFYN